MTTRECYDRIGGDYDDVMRRFRDDARVRRFAVMFLSDESIEDLERAMDAGSCEEAFRAAHTLKGVCLNLGFKKLYESVDAITEALRAGNMDSAAEILPQLIKDGRRTVEWLRELQK